MCFYNSRNLKKPKIAKTDIVCFKQIIRKANQEIQSLFFSDVREKGDLFIHPVSYNIGETYQATNIKGKKVHKLLLRRYNEINEGFHSYKKRRTKGIHYYINIKCIIPKGTQYYENDSEYVSTHIKFAKYLPKR